MFVGVLKTKSRPESPLRTGAKTKSPFLSFRMPSFFEIVGKFGLRFVFVYAVRSLFWDLMSLANHALQHFATHYCFR